MTKRLFPLSFLALGLIAFLPVASADEVKMKSGETYVGRITYEADDLVRIEVTISESIKETKILARADIESISKDAPDDVEFNRIQTLVPTGSLMQAEAYRQMLATGPDAFLKAFPDSKHVPKVTEIRATLAEELDKVERGFLKIDDDWISPQDKIDFKEIIDSRIRLLRMENFSEGGNYTSLIAAMREFEAIEKSYAGTPAYAKAVELAKQVVPTLGRQLQSMSRDADYLNAEYQKNLDASRPEVRQQLVEARAREDKTFADSVAADKKEGVKWVQLNPRSKPALDDYLKTASAELARLQTLDTAALAKQGEILYEADKLIAANDLAGARTKIAEAAAIVTQTVATGSKSKSPSKSKTKSKGKGGSGSYLAALNGKINAITADQAAKAKEREAAAKSQALTANLAKSGAATTPAPTDEPGDRPAEEGEEDTDAEKEAAPEVDEFAALASTQKKSDGKTSEKAKAPGKSKSKSKKGDEEEDEDPTPAKARPAPVVEDEGGFPFGLIVPILTALLVVTVVVLKVLGIGGKKGEE